MKTVDEAGKEIKLPKNLQKLRYKNGTIIEHLTRHHIIRDLDSYFSQKEEELKSKSIKDAFLMKSIVRDIKTTIANLSYKNSNYSGQIEDEISNLGCIQLFKNSFPDLFTSLPAIVSFAFINLWEGLEKHPEYSTQLIKLQHSAIAADERRDAIRKFIVRVTIFYIILRLINGAFLALQYFDVF